MKFKSFFLFLSIVVLGCITASPAFADSVPIQNASFEMTSGQLIPCGAGCTFNFGPIPGWTTTGPGDAGSWQPTSAYPAPDGSFVAYSNGGTISQTLAASLMPNTIYDLSVDIGHRPDGLDATYAISLYAGNTLLNTFGGSNSSIPLGTFAQESVGYTSGSTPFSGPLSIVLLSGGPQIDFDNVQLSATPVPEPGSLALLAAGLAMTLLVLRRR